ncbi:uncharacterized protein LOC142237433 [Haematobia irritans]|uniref:uncharacterized protein LOC142237433 n=1 Tax=Haematobia irritans TaxID=7368 RepID=UPI003F4F7D18
MTRHLLFVSTTACIWLLASAQYSSSLDKWSRQLEPTDPGVSDSFDWVPLAQSADSTTKDRSGNGRVLTYSQSFPPSAKFSDLGKSGFNSPQSPKPAPFDFPFQFQSFGNAPQTQSLRQSNGPLRNQDPTSQSFFKFEMPFNQQNSRPAPLASSGVNTGYQISHAFGNGGQATLFSSPLFNQQPAFPPEFHPIPQKPFTQALQQKPFTQQNVIEDPISLKNFFKDNKPLSTPTPSPLQAVTPQVFPTNPPSDSAFSLRTPFSNLAADPSAAAPGQDAQFLYVPYNDVYNFPSPQTQQQQQPQTQNLFEQPPKFNGNLPTVNPYQINQFYTPDPVAPGGQQAANLYPSTTIKPQTTSLKPSNIFQNFASPQFTTAAPKPKPKAHQPALAMFLYRASARPSQTDVVDALASAKNIAVIDAPNQNTPDIFVGPAGMPTPNGYTKFDLPYLSQLQSGGQDISDIPYFVAPLSYRTPGGFNKILLPEPHVGSIVVNLAKQRAPSTQQSNVYYQPQLQDIPLTTQRPRTSTQAPLLFHPNYQEVQTTTQRPRTSQRVKGNSNRGNKYSYYLDQDVIQEVSSPQITPQKDRPKKKRPQTSKVEQPLFGNQQLSNPYAQFNPIPNQITPDEYYKIATKPSSTSSTSTSSSTSTTTSTTSTTPPPQTYYAYNTQAQVEFPGSSGHLYHDVNQTPQPQPEEEKPRLTTRPPLHTTTAEEEYRMKQYYRQQDAIRNRPKIVSQSNSNYDQVQYTPVNFEYEVSPKTTTVKPRITFYTPTVGPVPDEEEYPNTLPPKQQQSVNNNNLPANHRPSYVQNEITDSPVEYDPNPYQLPSELPSLTPHLPGLVNNLKDMKEQQNTEVEQTTVTPIYEQESSTRPSRRPLNRVRKPTKASLTESADNNDGETFTRRPATRVRRPFGTRNSIASQITTNLEGTDVSTSTTKRPSASRNPLIRNPNRIRYKPTSEERQTLRLKPKKKYNGSSKVVEQTEDLDYQRDVLKQNYPVFRPSGGTRIASSPTARPSSYDFTTTEAPTSETQQVYTVTPSNNIDNEQVFPAGLLEPMQIAQQYNQYKDNYGPGYFPNQEDLNPTEPVRNEINPVYTAYPSSTPAPPPTTTTPEPTTTTTTTTTSTTTTTEAPVVITTRRSPFARRNYPRIRTTTTEAPTTTTPAAEDRPSIRNRLPPRKVIKVRSRTRRPYHPASSTAAPEEDNEPTEEPKQNYRKLNRFNQDLYDNETPRRRYKQKFQLEGQESQWSPAVKFGPTNNFKPVNPKNPLINKHKFEEEPEIVTAGPNGEGEDNYEVRVSANLAPSTGSAASKPQMKEPNLKPEKSFAELLEEVMGKAPEEKPVDMTTEASSDGTIFESQKSTIANRLNRRGKWKKTRIVSGQNNGESFETAESQSLGSQIFNSLNSKEKAQTTVDLMKDWKTTTPMTTAAEINAMYTSGSTTPMPLGSMEEYGITTYRPEEATFSTTYAPTTPMSTVVTDDYDMTESTTEHNLMDTNAEEENATRRMDSDTAMEEDLEIQPSLFSEVKKQLHELFSIEESDDTAVTAALAAVGKRRQEYTHIKRPKFETTTFAPQPDFTEPMSVEDKKAFHRELMKHVVYATSAPAKDMPEQTPETEICYRGRCIKSDDLPANHKLN